MWDSFLDLCELGNQTGPPHFGKKPQISRSRFCFWTRILNHVAVSLTRIDRRVSSLPLVAGLFPLLHICGRADIGLAGTRTVSTVPRYAGARPHEGPSFSYWFHVARVVCRIRAGRRHVKPSRTLSMTPSMYSVSFYGLEPSSEIHFRPPSGGFHSTASSLDMLSKTISTSHVTMKKLTEGAHYYRVTSGWTDRGNTWWCYIFVSRVVVVKQSKDRADKEKQSNNRRFTKQK